MPKLKNLTEPIVLLANGKFPSHEIPIEKLNSAKTIICCDGSAEALVEYGKYPDAIIGDLDSLPEYLQRNMSNLIINKPEQSENDLRKAISWVEKQGGVEITILGASGKREDHLIGNIFSILQFQTRLKILMITDYGKFYTIEKTKTINGTKGQQISLFSLDKSIKITTKGLKYSLQNESINKLYSGTLNEVIEDKFSITISHGKILLYSVFSNN